MPTVKRKLKSTIRSFSLLVLLGFNALTFGMMGCGGPMNAASSKYRTLHQNSSDLLADATVEQLQACGDEFAAQLDDDSSRVDATVQVDPDGNTYKVTVTGIPRNAEDLAACTRVTLQNMAISPDTMSHLRRRQTVEKANSEAPPKGNEMANPAILVEATVALAEFMAQHGTKTVLYAVTVEVLSAVAIAGATVYLSKNRWRKNCTDGYVNCIANPAGIARGNHWNETRCGTCRNVCDLNKGKWPSTIEMFPDGPVSCY